MDSPVQALWEVTQLRSLEDAFNTYVQEAQEDIRMSGAPERFYYASDTEQRVAAEKQLGSVVLGVLRYQTMADETVAIVLSARTENSDALGWTHLVRRGLRWRVIMNHRTHAGLDVQYLDKALWKKSGEDGVDAEQILRPDFLRNLGHEVLDQARDKESERWQEISAARLVQETGEERLVEEAEKCRMFLIRFPKSPLVPKVRERLTRINGLLVDKGHDAIEPYDNVKEYLQMRRAK